MRALVGRSVAWAILLLVAAGGVRAQDDDPTADAAPEDAAALREEFARRALAWHSAMAKLAGDERLAESEAKSVIAHAASFRRMCVGGGEDAPAARLEARFDETGHYDLALLLAMPEFKAWASENKLDGKAWLRWRLRAELLLVRDAQEAGQEEYRRNIEKLEKLPAALHDESMRGFIEEARWILALAEKTIALIPAPTEAEKRVLVQHGDALRKALDLAESAAPGKDDGGREGEGEPKRDAER